LVQVEIKQVAGLRNTCIFCSG